MKPVGEVADAVISALGLDEAAVAARKAFLGLTDADMEQLQKLHGTLVGIGPDFAKKFYDHMLRFPELRCFIQDESTLSRLQQTQAQYFNSLTAGEYGHDYIRNRLRVGLAQQRNGLGTQWYLGAYAKYLVDLLPEIWQRMHDDSSQFIASIQSLLKIVLLDMGLAIDTYIHADRQSILALKKHAELVFATIPDALVILNSDFKIVSANRAFLERFGLTEAHICEQPLLSLIVAEGFEDALIQTRDSGILLKDLPFDMGLTGGASLLPARVTLTGSHLAEEERFLVIIEDMTEQVRLQQALKESETSLLRAQEVAHIGSWRLDFKNGYLIWSPEAYRIFNLPQDIPITYKTFLSCVHASDREMVSEAWRAATKGIPYRIQHRIFADGEIHWVEERAEIEFDNQGDPLLAIGTVQDITERKLAETRIEHLAFYDTLTGLPNRTLFMDRLKQELASVDRHGQQLALLFLDLNRFKEINDTLGHDVGDRVLTETAYRYRQAMRAEETLARLSGDEFVILASGSGEAANRIVERINRALTDPITIQGQEFIISTSIGIAIFPEDGRSSEELLKHADIAMYRAKTSGSSYCFYHAKMGEKCNAHRETFMITS